MKKIVLLILFVALVVASCACASGSKAYHAAWAAGAKNLGSAGLSPNGKVKIYSPNHRSLIEYRNSSLWLYVNGVKKLNLSDLVGSVYLTEIEWSSDSSAFFVNASDGGSIGSWSTYIYEIDQQVVLKIPLTKLIKATLLRTDCSINSVSITWFRGHRELLVLQQVPDTSACENMGQITGYIVDLKSLSVVKYLSPKEVRVHYSRYLGVQAKSAVSG